MAKKGQVQLQTEVTSEEEWEKLLQRDGLILVDVYSEWCGPCLGMAANLKKIKLEIGGDMLQLATAKSDYIEALKRFKNKSEPTWMFISNKKMVNLMFGADAPKLTRLIIEELKLETVAASGEAERPRQMDITELAEEEQIRHDAALSIARAAKEKEEAKKTKELLERKTAECTAILENLSTNGTILVFPHARDKYQEALSDLMSEAGLAIQHTEKVKIVESILPEILFFTDYKKFPKKTVEDFTNNKLTLALLMKRSSENLPGDIDEVVLQLVYGNCRKPPGDEKSPSRKLMVVIEEPKVNEEEKGEKDQEENEKDQKEKSNPKEFDDNILFGIWAPPNKLAKAMVLKHLFPNISGPFVVPETIPPPLYVAVGFDAFKARDVMELSDQFPGQVMAYGFFTSDIPVEAQLIVKTIQEFDERKSQSTYDEKIVVQLAKTNPQCVMAFSELGPTYMSVDAIAGEIDCKLFFPPGYNKAEEEVKQEKKKSKKRGKRHAPTVNKEASVTASEVTVDHTTEIETDIIEDENEESDEEKPIESEDVENGNVTGADKATSPIQ